MWKAGKSGFLWAGILSAGLASGSAYAANTLTASEKKAGWILLFDGQDKNAHWRYNEAGNQANPWTIEDSAMRTVNVNTSLCTTAADQFSDFEWQVDWKLAKGGNSGLFIRVLTSTYNDGYEYAILDDENGADKIEVSKNPADKLPNGKMAYIKRTGAVYDMYPTTKDGVVGGQYYDSTVSKPYDQWSHGVIWADGNFIEHWLNGKKVVDVEIGSPDWDARFLKSKWNVNTISVDQWAKHPKGSLCLQAHGSNQDAWFRNIKVRPFTPGDTLISPSISPKGGSFSSVIKVGLEVAITGSTIRYTLDGTEPTETSPVYSDSINIAATTTLKAKTFRARFKNSGTEAAVFTKGASSLLNLDLSPEPRVSFSRISGAGFVVQNNNSNIFDVVVFDLSGSKFSAFSVNEKMRSRLVTGLRRGVYLVKLQKGNWTRLHKIAVD